MRRILMLVTVALVMAAMMVVMAMPAFADKGGFSDPGSCGRSKEAVHESIAIGSEPGASERVHPQHTICTGRT